MTLKELINKYCSDGVEYKKVEDILTTYNKKIYSIGKLDYLKEGLIPIIDQSIKFIAGYTNEEIERISIKECIVFGDHTRHIKWIDFDFAIADSGTKILIKKNPLDQFNLKYVYYCLTNLDIKNKGYARHYSSLREFNIPLPPLEVQEKIVNILNLFNELNTELNTEYAKRYKQYKWYLNNLLDFESGKNKLQKLIDEFCPDGIAQKTIKDIAEVYTGSRNAKDAKNNGMYPFYIRSETIKKIDTFSYDEEAILIPGEGGIGKIFHYVNGKYDLHQRVYRIHFLNHMVLTKFQYYYFSAYFKSYIERKWLSGTVDSIRKPMIEDFLVPIPPLEIQQKIVDILDKFDTLANDINIGLPKEIELNNKRYQYYRNKILSFNRKDKID